MKKIIVIDDEPESRRTTATWLEAAGHHVVVAADTQEAVLRLGDHGGCIEPSSSYDQADKAKSEFLSNMSHELRSPLNAMLLLAEDLARNNENLTKDQIESIQVIGRAGKNLLFLVNEILEISKLEAGRTRINIREIRLRSLADYIQALFGPTAEAKGLGFAIHFQDDPPEAIWTDHQKIEQILSNLVSNAIKFTLEGKIEVRFFEPSSDAGHSCPHHPTSAGIAIAVRDTGIGIPDDQQRNIFKAFQQVDSGASRKYGGTGLGLSISKKLTTLLGGCLHLDSRVNHGSVFTVYLPVDKMKALALSQDDDIKGDRPLDPRCLVSSPDGPQDAAIQPVPDHHPALAGRKIIVVDPDPRRLFNLAKMLDAYQLKAIKVIDAEKASALSKTQGDILAVVISIPVKDVQNVERASLFPAAQPRDGIPIIGLIDKDRPECQNIHQQEEIEDGMTCVTTLHDLVDELERIAVGRPNDS